MRVVGYRQRYPQPWGKTSDLECALREVKARKSPLECGLLGISGMFQLAEMAERTGLELKRQYTENVWHSCLLFF